MKWRERWISPDLLLWALLAVGLLARLWTLDCKGGTDVDQYRRWGDAVRQSGLAAGYSGVYFPIQFQLFAWATALGAGSRWDALFWLKAINLLFDAGTLGLLLASVPSSRRTLAALLYWVNPWFLALSAQAYCDFQMSFFLLAAVVILYRSEGIRAAALAGIPLGIAFLMKPQAIILVLALGILWGVSLLAKRPRWDALAAVGPSAVIFAGYSVYFWLRGQPIVHLAQSYLRTTTVMPSLTAQMLNLWYPLALLARPDRPVWDLRDDFTLFGASARTIAIGATLLLLALYALIASLREQTHLLARMLVFAAIVLPMVMTSSHENHLFFGTLGLSFLLLSDERRPGRIAWLSLVAILLVQTVNLIGLYGLGRNPMSDWAVIRAIEASWKHRPVHVLAAILDIAAFLGAITYLTSRAAPEDHPTAGFRRARAPALFVGCFLVAVYASALPRLGELRSAHSILAP